MNKEQLLKRLTALEDEAKQLREILEAPEKKERWRADTRINYYYIFGYGDISYKKEYNEEIDSLHHLGFNYFQTKEEAERIARVQLAYRKLDWAIRQFEVGDKGYRYNYNGVEFLLENGYFKFSPLPLIVRREDAEYILSNYKAELLTFLTGGEK